VVSLPAATWVVSATSFALLAALLFAWYPQHMAWETWLVMLVMLSFLWQWPMSHLARLSTPDCLVMLLQMASIYAWLQHRSFIMFALFCWLACFARPDALFLSIAWAICFAIPAKDKTISLGRACVLILFLVITCLAITHFSRWYSYGQFFIHNYVDRKPFPGQITDHLTFERYWTVFSPSLLLFLGAPRQIAMIMISLIAGVCYYLKSADNKRSLLLLVATWTALAGRFLLFPAWGDDRYYFAYWVPILFACGELISPYTSVLSKIIQAHRLQIRDL
jgi:hypothetical protein